MEESYYIGMSLTSGNLILLQHNPLELLSPESINMACYIHRSLLKLGITIYFWQTLTERRWRGGGLRCKFICLQVGRKGGRGVEVEIEGMS